MRFPNIHLLKIYNSKIGNVQLFKGDPPPQKKKHTEKTKRRYRTPAQRRTYIVPTKIEMIQSTYQTTYLDQKFKGGREVEFYNDTCNHNNFTKYQRKKNQDKIAWQQKIQKKRV